ncbi:MAG TPA: DNA cytosine methyltransferase [Pyrinomonadaceae bacterium]
MKSVELFAGAGGLALGVAKAGFKHEVVIERDEPTCVTLKENKRRGFEPVAHWKLFGDDVKKYDYRDIQDKVDLVAGGPPCQPFSIGGKHRAYNDARDMFPEAVRAVRELRPRAFIFENVKGLTRQSFFNYFNYIQLQLSYPDLARRDGEDWLEHLTRLERYRTGGKEQGLWYRVVPHLLNAADYGVPQRRERVFIVGFRSDLELEWSFPKATHSQDALIWSQWVTGEYWEQHGIAGNDREIPPRLIRKVQRMKAAGEAPNSMRWRTVRDAIHDLPDPETPAADSVLNHRYVPGARVYLGHTGSPLDEPAKTLKAGDHGVPGGENMLVRERGGVRYFTVRESARLQTFPNDYLFPVSWTESMRQLGNAVPVELAHSVASSVSSLLEGNAR